MSCATIVCSYCAFTKQNDYESKIYMVSKKLEFFRIWSFSFKTTKITFSESMSSLPHWKSSMKRELDEWLSELLLSSSSNSNSKVLQFKSYTLVGIPIFKLKWNKGHCCSRPLISSIVGSIEPAGFWVQQ